MRRNRSALLVSVCVLAAATGIGVSQGPELQQKITEVKEAAAANRQALAQYTWVEQVTISLKGEQKKQEHFQVRLGPDGKPQKQSLDPPEQAQPSGGRLKQHVIEKKKEEYKDYADQIKSLIQQYVPPDKDLLQQAAQKGNIALSPQPGAQGQFRLVVSNYVKQGDNMTLLYNRAQKALTAITIATYLNDPKDAVNVTVAFTSGPGGLNHVDSETINGVSKQLTIAIQNSNYQPLQQQAGAQ